MAKANGTGGSGSAKMLQAAAAAFGQQTNISKKSKLRYLMLRSEHNEKQIAELLQALVAYVRRMAKLRDAGDTVAESLNAIADGEALNPGAKQSVSDLSKTFRAVQDHRDSEILFLEDKLLPMIAEYGTRLKKQREELRVNVNKLFDGKSSSGSLSWIGGGGGGINRRSRSAERLDRREERSLQQTIQRWELKRNLAFKKILLKLILSELRFNIRSFNNFTNIYKHILDEMDPRADLQFFNEFFQFRPLKKSQLQSLDDDDAAGSSDTDTVDEDEDDDDDDEDDRDDDQDSGHDHSSNLDENSLSQDSLVRSAKEPLPSPVTESAAEIRKLSGKKKSSTATEGAKLKRFNSTPEIITSDLNKSQLALFTRKSNNSGSKLVTNLFGRKKPTEAKSKKRTSNKNRKQEQDLEDDEDDSEDEEDSDDDSDDVGNDKEIAPPDQRRTSRASSARNPPSSRHR